MTARGARWTALILALALGQCLYLQARSAWTNYWLLHDARRGSATVTKELWSGHDAVGYTYVVDQTQFSGRSGRNSQDPQPVQVGGVTTVYYSASHPGISLLYMPQTVLEGLPVIIIVLVFEAFACITIINPKSGWAFSLADKQPENDVQPPPS